MAKIKYYYDTETCRYERARITSSDVVLNMLGFLSVALLLAVAIVLLYNTYYDSPTEKQLKKENQELLTYYEKLKSEMTEVNNMVTALEERDDNIYRKIYEAEPLPATVRQAGHGGVEAYKKIIEKGLHDEELVINTFREIDKLKRKARIQNQSFDQVMQMARKNKEILSSLPVIQPIENEELTKLASGYGMRINPFHKGRVKHSGIDFAAPRGAEVFATGNGEVKAIKNNSKLETGYGNYIEIDHGFGYITKYAHLGKLKVAVGEQVQRGQVIALVGSSGGSVAPHVHYEVIKDKKKIDPVNFLIQGLNDDDYKKLLDLATHENQSFD